MRDHRDDLRFPHLRVCREHGRPYDPEPHPESGQQQHCHSSVVQDKWPRFDFNEWVHLCECCLQDTSESGSRFSTFFCDTCLILLKTKAPAVPRGRHTLMNVGVMPAGADAFLRRFEEMNGAIDQLHHWSGERLRRLLDAGNGDPALAAVMTEARRRWDKEEAVRNLAEFWNPPRR